MALESDAEAIKIPVQIAVLSLLPGLPETARHSGERELAVGAAGLPSRR